jgi:hypothetical protein
MSLLLLEGGSYLLLEGGSNRILLGAVEFPAHLVNTTPQPEAGEAPITIENDTRVIAAGVTDGAFVTEFDSAVPFTVCGPIYIETEGSGTGDLTFTVALFLNGREVDRRTGIVHTVVSTGLYCKIGPRSPQDPDINDWAAIVPESTMPEMFSSTRVQVKVQVTANTRSANTTIRCRLAGYSCSTLQSIREFLEFRIAEKIRTFGPGAGVASAPFSMIHITGPGRVFGPVACTHSIDFGAGEAKFEMLIDGVSRDNTGDMSSGGGFHPAALGYRSVTYVQNVANDDTYDMRDKGELIQAPGVYFNELRITARVVTIGVGPSITFLNHLFYGLYE